MNPEKPGFDTNLIPEERIESFLDKKPFLVGEVPGRAEYEDMSGKELFDSAEIEDIFPWAFAPGFDKGMIVAPRGSGKTFFVRQLLDKMPGEIHLLDKKNLNYFYKKVEKPKLIVIDDLHYLLDAKKKDELDQSSRISDEEILRTIEDAISLAEELDIKIIFVSDGLPQDLYDRFEKKEDKMRFLRLMEGIGITKGDLDSVEKGDFKLEAVVASRGDKQSRNVLKFREIVSVETIKKMRAYLGMTDLPFFQETIEDEVRPESAARLVMPNAEFNAQVFHDIDDPRKFILTTRNNLLETGEVNKWGEKDQADSYNLVSGETRPMARLRELIAIYQKRGAVNRSTLGVDFGYPSSEFFAGKPVYDLGEPMGLVQDWLMPFITEYEKWENLDTKAKENHSFEQYLKSKGPRVFINWEQKSAIDARQKLAVSLLSRGYAPGLKTGDKIYDRTKAKIIGWTAKGKRSAGGWCYDMDEIRAIERGLSNLYFEVSGREELTPLVKKLLALTDDDKAAAEQAFIEHRLGQE